MAAPDGRAGLHVRDRAGRIVRAAFPADHLAFQMGEAMQARALERLCCSAVCKGWVQGMQSPPIICVCCVLALGSLALRMQARTF